MDISWTVSEDVSPTVETIRAELKRLRHGAALTQPDAILQLTPQVRRLLLPDDAPGRRDDAEQVLALTAALTAAMKRLRSDQLLSIRVDLNLAPEHTFSTLTQRQESLASHWLCAAKTVRRRSEAALRSLAILIATGERGVSVLEWQELEPGSKQSDALRPRSAVHKDTLGTFWRLAPGSRVDIVCSEIPESERPPFASPGDRNYLRYAKFADLDTLIYLRTRLSQLEPRARLRDFAPDEHHGDDAETLVVVGGPPWNSKYREFLPQLPFHFEPHPPGEDDPLVIPQREVKLGPRWTRRGDLLADLAVLTRMTLSQGPTVLLLGGCLTLGVLGAARLVLQPGRGERTCDYLNELVGEQDVVVVTEAHRVGDMTDVADLTVVPPLLVMTREHHEPFTIAVDNLKRYLYP